MNESDKILSQKEYLKKYLSNPNEKKEKKKKKTKISSSTFLKRSVIIDDDVPLAEIPMVKEEEIINFDILGDEAPQIAGFVDDRPLDMIWKPLGAKDEDNEDEDFDEKRRKDKLLTDGFYSVPKKMPDGTIKKGSKRTKNDKNDIIVSYDKRPQEEVKIKKYEYEDKRHRDSSIDKYKDKRKRDTDSDNSLDRRHKNDRRKKHDSDSDVSVERKRNRNFERKRHPKRRNDDSDVSVERYRNKQNRYRNEEPFRRSRNDYRNGRNMDRRRSPRRFWKNISPDVSPKRKNQIRKTHYDENASPPRKHKIKKRMEENVDSDGSPPRRNKKHAEEKPDSDASPPRKNKKRAEEKPDSDASPPRKNKKRAEEKADSDASPPRKNKKRPEVDSDPSPPRKNKYRNEKVDSDASPPRRKKMNKTLDGKKAGLQNAKNLKDELRQLKEKEEQIFRQMDPATLGQAATTVVRDRRTGLRRDIDKEIEQDKEKAEREAIRKAKYDRWGKGLKQTKETEDKIADALHEMSKPLARYKDDEDLDKYLKQREREGDPMLDYIRKHQAESHSVIDLTAPGTGRKKYQGNFNINRFGIAPGYRWDGVDRSNGYEQKWFEHKSAMKAGEEEVYKWSVSDM